MATITALPGIKTAFSGGADNITCIFPPAARNGVQVEAQGFTLNNSTVTAYGISSTEGDTVSFTEAKHIIIIGSSNASLISKVDISAVAGGSYFVTFTAL